MKLTDLTQLDEISYDEVDKILARYEDLYVIIEYRLQKFGALDDAETYRLFDGTLSELRQTSDIKKRRAIANQIKEAHMETPK